MSLDQTHSIVTYGVTTTGNTQALCMSLATVLMQTVLPMRILIRSEGEFPATSDFYLEQIAELARHKGVEFSLSVCRSAGVRAARDWLIEQAALREHLLWMGDDDVIFAPHCLENLIPAQHDADVYWAFIVGNKPDLNNRRGYPDFSKEVHNSAEAQDNAVYNFFYEGPNRIVRSLTCDTGNVLIDAPKIKKHGIKIDCMTKSYNSGGEDTLFAMLCLLNDLTGWFATRADSFHLEKQKVRFGEFAARKQQLLREAEILCQTKPEYKTAMFHLVDQMMPFVK